MKNKKKIPKSYLPKYSLGTKTPNTRVLPNGNEVSDAGTNGTTNIYNEGRQSKINADQYTQAGSAIAMGGVQAFQGYNDPYSNDLQKTRSIQAGADTAKIGVASAVNPLLGAAVGAVTKIGSGIQNNVDRTDENGNLINRNDSKFGEIAGGFLSPSNSLIGIYTDPNATTGQKVAGALTGGLSDMFTNRHRKQVESNAKANLNQYPNGGINMQPNAEIESEENVVAPNGGFLQANGPTHEQGGVPVALPGNSMIFSDRLKLGKKTFAELNKVNNTNKEDKVLDSNKYGTTSKRTAELMKFAKNKNSEELFNAQEALKQAKVEAYAKKMGVALPQAQEAPEESMQFPMGGVKLPMYPLGGPTDNTKFTPGQRQQAYADSMTLYKSGFNKNIPNWQAEPGFNEAALRLNKLNGTPPESTDKSPIASDYNYLQNRSVPYAKPTFPGVQYKKEVSPLKQSYPMERLPLKDLNNPVDINPQFQSVPTNRPNTIKTQIQTGPNMSYKEYKQGNEVLDRAYFDPSTKKEINIEGFAMGGRKLPKYTNAGLTPDQEFLKTKFMGAEQNQRNLAFNKMTGNMNPGYNVSQSAWSPEELQASSDEMVSESYPEKASTTLLNQSKTYPIRRDKNGKLLFDTPTSNNAGSKRDQELYDAELAKMNASEDSKNFDWKGLGSNVAMGLANNAGNIYNLSRYNKPEVESYERMKATYLDPTAAMRDANEQTRRAEYNVRGASAGNAGTYLSNRVALNTQNIENKDRIRQQYANANAGIANSTAQYNNELARQEVIANAQNRARNRSGKGEAIGSTGYNVANQMMDNKKGNMDQETLQLMMKYYNDPQFKKYLEESGFNKKKTGK